MRFQTAVLLHASFAAVGLCAFSNAQAQQPERPTVSQTEQVLETSSQEGRFTFLVFYKIKDTSMQTMTEAVEKGIAAKAEQAKLAFVQVTNQSEKKLVDKLGVSRAPMPLCVVIAPNGAVTGLFRKPPSAQDVSQAFVTPTMTRCMKAMQDGKVVLICVKNSPRAEIASAVTEFQNDPDFKDRIATVTLNTNDPAEADFLTELAMDVANSQNIATVMLASPGVLVGKYKADASHAEMAAELHAAGKCCDDPNCKHRQQTGGKANSTTTQKAPATRRK